VRENVRHRERESERERGREREKQENWSIYLLRIFISHDYLLKNFLKGMPKSN
jgi:hypothetical protein